MVLHTPLPYFLSLPWREVCAWAETVDVIRKKDAAERS